MNSFQARATTKGKQLMPCAKNSVCMATHWNAWKKPLDTADSTLTGFSNSFVLNSLHDSWQKPKQKYTLIDRLKWSPRDAHRKESIDGVGPSGGFNRMVWIQCVSQMLALSCFVVYIVLHKMIFLKIAAAKCA